MAQDLAYLGGPRRQISGIAVQGLGVSQPRRISIEGGRFHLVDETGVETPAGAFDQAIGVYIDLVVVDANQHPSKVFYEGAYDPGAAQFQPPDCFSDNGVAPSINSSRPQSQTCAACNWNSWGSDVSLLSGKATKACADKKKLACIVGNDPKAYLLSIPPASLKFWRSYNEWIAQQQLAGRQADVSDLVTRVYFPEPNKLAFRTVGMITPELAAIENAIWANNATDAVVGRNDRPINGAMAPGTAGLIQQQQPQIGGAALPGPAQRPLAPPPNPPLQQAQPGQQRQLPQQQQPDQFHQGQPQQQTGQARSADQQQPPAPRQRRTRATPTNPPGNPQQQQPLQQMQPQGATGMVQQGGTAGMNDPLDIPPFLQRGQQAPQGQPQQGQPQQYQQPQQQQPQTGIQTGAEASPEMMAAINDAFNLPTGR